MVRRIMRFRVGLIAVTAVLVGAVLAAAPASASAAQASKAIRPAQASNFYSQLYRYNQTNPVGFECVTEGAHAVSMQPCISPYDDAQEWGYPDASSDIFENQATGQCLNGEEGSGVVTTDPCDTSAYPGEDWTWKADPNIIFNITYDECLNADAASGVVTMDPCDTSTYPGEIINYLEISF